jgi:hypothetical protein
MATALARDTLKTGAVKLRTRILKHHYNEFVVRRRVHSLSTLYGDRLCPVSFLPGAAALQSKLSFIDASFVDS